MGNFVNDKRNICESKGDEKTAPAIAEAEITGWGGRI